MNEADDSIDAFVDRLRKQVNLDSLLFLQTDPAGLEGGLRRVQADLERMIGLSRDAAHHARKAPLRDPAVVNDGDTTGPIRVDGLTDGFSRRIAHLNVQQLSGVREVALLHEIVARNGGATLSGLRDAVADLWQASDLKSNDAALRQQISRLVGQHLIESVTNGNYRITVAGRNHMMQSARLRIGLIQEARPNLVVALQSIDGWDNGAPSH